MTTKLLSKNFYQWLFLLVCFVCTLSSWAETVDGVTYYVDKATQTATVTGLADKNVTSIEIKSVVAGCEVTTIGRLAFYGYRSLTTVKIPRTVKVIREYAFSGCNSLKSVSIPNSVTIIRMHAFERCTSLKSIVIPESVEEIGENAFFECSSLTSINIPSSVTKIGEKAFSCCNSLTSITVDADNPHYRVEDFVLYNKDKTTIVCAFGNQKDYYIPSYVTSIKNDAFTSCNSPKSFTVDTDNPNYSADSFMLFSKDKTTLICAVGNHQYNIPSSVTSIYKDAFLGCSSSFVTVDEDNPNYSTDGYALFNKDMTTLIRYVGGQGYLYSIPSSVTRIEEYAFRGCNSPTTIDFPNSEITSIGSSAFSECTSLRHISIPYSVKNIGGGAFFQCTFNSIDIPSSVTSIGGGAFSGCSSLTSINIPNSVTNIEGSAFYLCRSLTSINIPSSVTSIEHQTFWGCSALTSINIPSSVTSIGDKTFEGCNSLTSINIPSSVTSIGGYAFSGCSALKTIVLQSNSIKLQQNVFYGCGSIYAISDNLKIALSDDKSYGYTQGTHVNDYLGGTSWYTCGTPTISYKGSAVSDNLWNSSLLDSNTAQYLRTIFQTSTNAQTLISKYNTIYCNLSEDLRKSLEDNLQKVNDYASVIAASNEELFELSTNLSKAYKNVCEAVYGSLGLSDLYKLYAQAEDFTSALDNTPDYSPLLPTYTAGNNILTSADQLSTNKPESEGPISNLVDGNKNTFFHSTWSAKNEDNAFAYLQIDLKGAYNDLLVDYTKRYNFTGNKGYPTQFHVFATNTPNDEESWKDCGYSNQLSYRYDNQQSGKTILNLDGDYQYLRLQVEKTGGMAQTNGNLYFALGELAIYPVTSYKDAPYTEKDGLITDASQLSSNAIEPQEGSLAELIDNDITTYFHSTWSQNNATGAKHYLQVDLNDAYKQIALKYSKRQVEVDNGSPVTLHIYATNTPEDANSWTDLGTQTCAYDYNFGNTGLLPLNFGDTAYRHIRLTVEETTGNSQLNGNLFFYWSELHAYTRASQADKLTEATRTALTTAMQQAKAELDAKWATDATYEALETAYNAAKNEVGEGSRLVDFAKSFYLTAYSDQALVVPAGVKAAVVTANGEGIRNDYRYNSGDVIPAETGVLLRGGKGNSFYLSASESTEMAPEDNLLHGTLTNEMTNVAGTGKYYKLSYDRATGSEIGFYWGAANGGAFMNKGGKAFLAIPATLQAAQLTGFSLFDLDNNQAITGIEHAIATPAATLRVYDLNGRRINANHVDELPQGIYVINGKKVIR